MSTVDGEAGLAKKSKTAFGMRGAVGSKGRSRLSFFAIPYEGEAQLGVQTGRLGFRVEDRLVEAGRFTESPLLPERLGIERAGKRRLFVLDGNSARVALHLIELGDAQVEPCGAEFRIEIQRAIQFRNSLTVFASRDVGTTERQRRLSIGGVCLSCPDEKWNRLVRPARVRVVNPEEEVRNIQGRSQAIGALESFDGSGNVTGFLLRKAQVSPDGWHIGAHFRRLCVVVDGRYEVSARLRLLSGMEQRFQGDGWLLGEAKGGPAQHNQEQRFGDRRHDTFTSRTCQPTECYVVRRSA